MSSNLDHFWMFSKTKSRRNSETSQVSLFYSCCIYYAFSSFFPQCSPFPKLFHVGLAFMINAFPGNVCINTLSVFHFLEPRYQVYRMVTICLSNKNSSHPLTHNMVRLACTTRVKVQVAYYVSTCIL